MHVSTTHYFGKSPPIKVSMNISSDGSGYIRISIDAGDIGIHLTPEEARALRDGLSVALADLAERDRSHA